MNANAIEIRGLEKHFRKFTLGPLDATVPRGAIYGLIGPNGAGKTTTIDLALGLGREDAGSIKVLDLDHRRDEVAMKRQVGYASPEVSWLAWGKVGKAIQFVRGFYPTWDDAYCLRLLDSLHVGLGERIATLSFGARIKFGLILALAWRPKLLLLDEPLIGLDAVSKHQVFSELLAAVQSEDRAVVISSHNLSDLERFADHIGMIKNGKMLLEGPTAEIVERFRWVDFVAENGADFSAEPGLLIRRRNQRHWQALADTSKCSLDDISSRGARQLNATPVTLEDLFVALAQE